MAQCCDHCGLPVWESSNNSTSKDKHGSKNKKLFCCYGCEMLHEMDVDANDFSIPHNLLIRWIIAFVCSMLLVLLSITSHLEQSLPLAVQYFSLFLATTVLMLLGREVFKSLLNELESVRLSLASLIFLGTAASYLISLYNFFYAGNPTYFETSAMLLCFYVGSIMVDIRLKDKIRRETKNWQMAIPEVLVKDKNGHKTRKPADQIKKSESILTEIGASVPVDGVLKSELGCVNESFLTGEEQPVTKKKGEQILAGSIAYDHHLEIKPVTGYSESSLQKYWQRYRNISVHSTRIEELAQRFARYMLMVIIPVALLVFGWYSWFYTIEMGLNNGLSVLLISCPCAFAIAVPAALWIAQSVLQNNGILTLSDSRGLEQLAKSDHLIFDKTGTLTKKAEIYQFVQINHSLSRSNILNLMYALEAEQEHPIAEAIRRYSENGTEKRPQIEQLSVEQGMGISGIVKRDDSNFRTGIYNHLHEQAGGQLQNGEYGLYVEDELIAKWSIYYPLKHHVREMLSSLSKSYSISILSGDPVPKKELTGQDWIYLASQSPEEKATYVEECRKRGESVFFIGDGINDLMAMAKADVTLAMFEGANQAKTDADFVQYHPDIQMVPRLLSLAGRTKRTLYQNIFWAIIYNFVGLFLAIGGYLNPVISIGAMILSSIFVTVNSVRIKKYDNEYRAHPNTSYDAATLGANG